MTPSCNRLVVKIGLATAALFFCGCEAPDQAPIEPAAQVSGSNEGARGGTLEERIAALKIPRPAANPQPLNTGPQQTLPLDPVPLQPPPPVRNDPQDLSAAKVTVQIFVEEWSPLCKELERFLVKNKIKYIKYNVAKDFGAKEYARRITGDYSVPLILVGPNVIHGLDLAKVKEAVRIYTPSTNPSIKGYTF